MSINILSHETINKIAAGEVIERPLNVVKELVENSLDAFASSVIAEILGAGKKFIRVSDNGLGMNRKDLELSILRHATSKIKDFSDLSQVRSLGFRGEALASIVTISNFRMKTKKKGEFSGWELLSNGGKNVEVAPWSGSEGTISEVGDLFFNTPARQKFLKSDSTERSRIISLLEEMALANQCITFKMLSENKMIFFAPKTDNKTERILDVLGKDFSKAIRNVKFNHSKISLDIYFTGKDYSLSSRRYQYLFVNSRPINYPKWLIHCVYQVYGELIHRDKHPGILIYIDINPSEIDVNIHPTKREVKFANENSMYNMFLRLLKNAIISHEYSKMPINFSTNDNVYSSFDNRYHCGGHTSSSPFLTNGSIFGAHHSANTCYTNESSFNYTIHKKVCDVGKYVADAVVKEELSQKKFFDNSMRIVGQVFGTYIIVESKGDLCIFDQHAVAERIKYELYLSQVEIQAIKVQQVLVPVSFDLPTSFSELLKANIAFFNEIGIIIEEFGQNSFRITAYPILLGNVSIERVVRTIILDIENDKTVKKIEQVKDKIIRSACRTSVRAGDSIAFSEAENLIKDLFKCKLPFTCPHGRPVVYKISLKELEKFFKRR
ncbi:MAG: DNA mismatch repair endonuclease MutL [Endomicrobium sp.]|jgi:DNA mismatch repair protein MutL|nr:DNA mismatch repair endonuclease MutL [Endomicrobium sp.]